METSIKQHSFQNHSRTFKNSSSSQHSIIKNYLPTLRETKHVPRGMGTLNQRYQIQRTNRLLCNKISEIVSKPPSIKTKGYHRGDSKIVKQKNYFTEMKLNQENLNLAKRIWNQKSYYSYRSKPQHLKTHSYNQEHNMNQVLYNRCKPIGQEYYYITIFCVEKIFKIQVENIDLSEKYLIQLQEDVAKDMLFKKFNNDINNLVESIRINKEKNECNIDYDKSSYKQQQNSIIQNQNQRPMQSQGIP